MVEAKLRADLEQLVKVSVIDLAAELEGPVDQGRSRSRHHVAVIAEVGVDVEVELIGDSTAVSNARKLNLHVRAGLGEDFRRQRVVHARAHDGSGRSQHGAQLTSSADCAALCGCTGCKEQLHGAVHNRKV